MKKILFATLFCILTLNSKVWKPHPEGFTGFLYDLYDGDFSKKAKPAPVAPSAPATPVEAPAPVQAPVTQPAQVQPTREVATQSAFPKSKFNWPKHHHNVSSGRKMTKTDKCLLTIFGAFFAFLAGKSLWQQYKAVSTK